MRKLGAFALALGVLGLFTGGGLVVGSALGLGLALFALAAARSDLAFAALCANTFALLSAVPLAMTLTALRPWLSRDDSAPPEPIAETYQFFAEPGMPIPPPPPPPPPRVIPDDRATSVADPEPAALRVGGNIREPRRLNSVAPAYPEVAKQARVQGVVVLECVINPQGEVVSVSVLRGVPLLDEAAISAVRQWRYTPTLLDGQPVSVIMTVTVNFRL